jgi:hypothetical protein
MSLWKTKRPTDVTVCALLLLYAKQIVARDRRDMVGKPEGKRSLGRPRRGWKNDIKWILKKLDKKA